MNNPAFFRPPHGEVDRVDRVGAEIRANFDLVEDGDAVNALASTVAEFLAAQPKYLSKVLF